MSFFAVKLMTGSKTNTASKKFNRSITGNAAIAIVLFLMSAFMALPLIYSIINSLKPVDELFMFPPRFFVRRPTSGNFQMLFKLTSNLWVPFSRYVFNSLFVSIAATAGHVVIASMAAYPLAKFKLKYGWLFNVVIGALLFNTTVLWIPQYVLLSRLNIMNTYWVYILPILPLPLGLFLMKQFMERVPISLIESARIDGASHFKTLWCVVMPQVKPAWLTLTVFAFQIVWNQQPMNYVFDEELKLINIAISQVILSGGMARIGPAMAASVVMMIPPIIVFILTQNSVIETMVASGIKE